ncbi:MAG TPA: VOC family protein, partial [Actinomycetes bacterium]|nr:VOC family protein [Actinomycetes bacterium]
WAAETLDAPGVNYVTWKLGGRTVGGMLEMTPEWEGIAAHWMTYFAVLDTADAAKRASDLGGSVGAPPTAFGRSAVLADPAGGHFSVITPVRQAAG